MEPNNFGQALHEAADVSSGLLHVMQVVGQAVLVHTGRASASTLARNFSFVIPRVVAESRYFGLRAFYRPFWMLRLRAA